MIAKYSAIAVFSASILSPNAAAGSDADDLALCDKAIATRQVTPLAYRRISQTLKTRIFSRAEVMDQLIPKDKPERIERFDNGTWSPRETTIVVDYEATTKDAELITKRSVCELSSSREDDLPPVDMVVVDGEMEFMR